MSDVNYIKAILSTWYPCKNWLEKKYPEAKFKLDHKLKNLKGISYEEKLGGTSLPEWERRNQVIDEMNELEEERRQCEKTIKLCEAYLSKIPTEYHTTFRLLYEQGNTLEYVAMKVPYNDAKYVHRLVDRETQRILIK